MSVQRKQHADLIRHRELNALRRLMVGRHPPDHSMRSSQLGQGSPATAMQHTGIQPAVLRIDELEMQMDQALRQRAVTGDSETQREFQPTHILATNVQPIADESGQAVISQAATLFAQRRDLAARQLLLSAIGVQGEQYDHVPTWLVLFDLYRATGQVALFEALALDFSVRFGRSTPAWLSLPDLMPSVSAGASPLIGAAWQAPAYLDEPAVLSLQACWAQSKAASQALKMDWRALVDVQPTAWQGLRHFLEALADHPSPCALSGLAVLELTFTNALAESMLAKLALLRCLRQAQAYEAFALDYCTAFEVSPPDWRPGQCQIRLQDLSLATQIKPMNDGHPTQEWELAGDMHTLPPHFAVNGHRPSDRIDVRCNRLVRCSPDAAQALKLWAQTLKASGTQVVLQDVHRVLAAYFLSLGLYEFAKVSIRKD